jgi:hypothetical protein
MYNPQDGILNKVHGLSLTNDSSSSKKDSKKLVHVYIEIPNQNKISINEIVIDDMNLPPYDFKYQLIEFREYINDFSEKDQDEIEKYQFIFTNENTHIGVAKK